MKIYKVGGAVRDQLLGYPHHETDWVVIGAVPQNLLDQGFTQVGRDFPVFLHPDSKEEYALARTERKTGRGYHGFVVHAEPSVTLEEDLERRDLTINAMAQSEDGTLIDPYGGKTDLEARVLRHVSPHFVEDPLRVLRVARFAARYAHLDFTVAPETLALMRQIVAAGELEHLSIERVWVETDRALGERNPEVYFDTLRSCGALERLLPAVVVTSGIGALARAAPHTERRDCRWAALLSELPGVRAEQTSDTIKAPNAYRDLAIRVCEWRSQTKDALKDPGRCLELLRALDALRRDEPFAGYVETLAALEGTTADAHEGLKRLMAARETALGVRAADLASEGLSGPALGEAIRDRQRERVAEVLAAPKPAPKAAPKVVPR